MKTKFFATVLILMLGKTGFAQNLFESQEGEFATHLLRGDFAAPDLFSKEMEVNGSPYFNNDFCDGELWLTKGRHYKTGYQYKFDESKNLVIFKSKEDSKVLEIASNEFLGLQISYKGKMSLFFKSNLPNESNANPRIFQMLYYSKGIKFYKLPVKKLYEVTRETNTGSEKFVEYKPLPRYFIQFEELPPVEFNLNKKSFLQAMNAKYGTAAQKLLDSTAYKGMLTEEKAVKLLQEIDAPK